MGLESLIRLFSQLCLAVCWLSLLSAEDKWIWGNNRGRDGLRGEHSIARPVINGNYATSASAPLFSAANKNKNNPQGPLSDDPGEDPRYEVYESDNGPSNANELPGRPPIRPPTQYPGPGRPPLGAGRPPLGPGGGPPPQLPPRPPGPGLGPGPLGNRPPPPLPHPGSGPQGGQGNPDLGVLTGPVPSWERPPPHKNNDPTSFDSCKCVNSFNCKSPGLKFGTCDVGKFYCCYNNPGFGVYPSGATPSFGAKEEGGPTILAGPNGPVDQPHPDFLRPPGGPFPNEALFNRRPPPTGPGFGPLPFGDTILPRSTNRKISRS